MSGPLVSTVIVSYNSRADLEDCLPTLFNQRVSQEIIVVDNGSTDGTPEWIRTAYPEVQVIETGRNDGYAGANNLGAMKAKGEYIFILNPDTELHPRALEAMLRVVMSRPDIIVTPKLLQADGTINACGTKMHITGITTCNGVGELAEAFVGVFPVFLVSGAAFLLHRRVWNDIGGFGPEYFMYMEDIDFALRARLFGYDIACCAEASILHKWELNLGVQKFFWLERNRLMTLLRIYETKTFYRLAFSFFCTELATWAYAAYKGLPYLKARVRSYGSLWRMRETIKQSRASIQQKRKVSDRQLISHMSSALPINLLLSPRMARILLRMTTPLYKAFYVWGDRT